jgi:hypothetical protein
VIFGIFLGGWFITRVWLNECLVDVSKFLQSFPYLCFTCILLMKLLE